MSGITEGGTSPEELAAEVGQWFHEFTGESGAGVVVAVSGGMDSMVLLDILASDTQVRPRLHVAHFDHQLRPESGDDAAFVAGEAARRDLPVTTAGGDVRCRAAGARISLEMAARELRFEFLHRVMSEAGCEFIALGHHADDQAETVIMRLLRGSASGLGGMAPFRGNRYLRPLLNYPRSTLARYAEDRGVFYREDASNQDPKFLRNRVRWELLPRLRSFNPQIVPTLTRSSELLRDEDDWLAREASAAVTEVVMRADSSRIVLAAHILANYHTSIQRRVLRHSLQAISPPRAEAGRAAIDTLVELAQGAVAGIVDLGFGNSGSAPGRRSGAEGGSSGPGGSDVPGPRSRVPPGALARVPLALPSTELIRRSGAPAGILGSGFRRGLAGVGAFAPAGDRGGRQDAALRTRGTPQEGHRPPCRGRPSPPVAGRTAAACPQPGDPLGRRLAHRPRPSRHAVDQAYPVLRIQTHRFNESAK